MKTRKLNLFKLIKGFLLWTFLFQCTLGLAQSSTVDSYIETFMDQNHIPGCAALIVKQGRVVYEKYFGYANLETSQPVTFSTIVPATG